MGTIHTAIGGLKRLWAKSSHSEAQTDTPSQHVAASLDILETTLTRLADQRMHSDEQNQSPPIEVNSKQKMRRMQKECERYSAQVRELKQSLGKASSAFHKREDELTATIRKMTEDVKSGTVLLEEAMHELAKQKKAYNELKKKVDSEDYTAKRIEEERHRIMSETQQEITAVRDDLARERDGHRKTLIEQAKKMAALRRAHQQMQTSTQRFEERLESERRKSAALGEKARAWEETLNRHVESLSGSDLPNEWRLRLDEERAYGPVDIRELYGWAAECRLGPNHEVSRDGRTWIKAAEVPELRMDWYIKLLDGTSYGPINIFAVTHLLAEGVAQPAAEVTHRNGGAVHRADMLREAEIAEIRERNDTLSTELTELRSRVAEAQSQGQRLFAEESPVSPDRTAEPPPKLIHRIILQHDRVFGKR